MTTRRHLEPPRRLIRLLAILGLVALALLTAGPAAASTCGDKVIDDWYDGRIDGTYPLPCYDDAIEQLPRDLRDYSSAPDDIRRALQAAMRGEKAPPNRDAPPTDEKPNDPPATPPNNPDDPDDPNDPDDPRPADTVAAPTDTGGSASSLPVPLLVLAGLALLLIAGGSAGYVVRRFQARRVTPPPPAV